MKVCCGAVPLDFWTKIRVICNVINCCSKTLGYLLWVLDMIFVVLALRYMGCGGRTSFAFGKA